MSKRKEIKKSVYIIKKLIPASDVDASKTGFYAAVPDKGYKGHPFKIKHLIEKDINGEKKYILLEKVVPDWNKAEMFRRFEDMWGRGAYTLGYFKMSENYGKTDNA